MQVNGFIHENEENEINKTKCKMTLTKNTRIARQYWL